jgi:3-keto-disaccharide hydrolase
MKIHPAPVITSRLCLVLLVLVSAAPCVAQEPGFTSLLDGKTLAGWEGDEKVFRVVDGAIVAGSVGEKIAHNEFLASKDEFGDFELRLKARLVGQGQNAGVQFRSQRIANHFEMIGYQCDMGTMQGRPIWGALYDESRRRKFLAEPEPEKLAAALKPADWNELIIRCEGPRIQIWVNGVQTVDYTEPAADVPRRGRLGLQIHGGEPAEAAYKDIQIKTLGN